MKFLHLAVLSAALIALPMLAQAEVYKWKDKDGQTRYTDTPPPSNIKLENIGPKKLPKLTGKEPLSAVTNAQPAPVGAKKIDAEQPPVTINPEDTAARLRQQTAETEKRNKQEKESQAKLKAENCKAAKANLESYAQGGRIYKMNEKGEREYLDDAGLKNGANKARGEVSEYCG